MYRLGSCFHVQFEFCVDDFSLFRFKEVSSGGTSLNSVVGQSAVDFHEVLRPKNPGLVLFPFGLVVRRASRIAFFQ